MNKGKKDAYSHDHKHVHGYVPPNAEINLENLNQKPPVTQYNNRMKILELNEVKKVVKGKYGREN